MLLLTPITATQFIYQDMAPLHQLIPHSACETIGQREVARCWPSLCDLHILYQHSIKR
jgi:hypothetical protein